MEMFPHDSAGRDDQSEVQFRAQFAKHIDEVASPSLAAKQLDTPIDARGDKLLVARRVMPVVKRHGRSKYNPNVKLDNPKTHASEGLHQPACGCLSWLGRKWNRRRAEL
jgi:hypothetical protein